MDLIDFKNSISENMLEDVKNEFEEKISISEDSSNEDYTHLDDLESTIEETMRIPLFKNQFTACNVEENILTEVEQRIINSCEDSCLKQVLAANRSKAVRLAKMCKFYHKAIETIDELMQREFQQAQEMIENVRSKELKKNNIQTLVMPYFKSSLMSIDYISMLEKGDELHFGHHSVRWNSEDMNILSDAIRLHYFTYRLTQINNKLKSIYFQTKSEHCRERKNMLEETLTELLKQKEILQLENPKAAPPLDSQEYAIDWEQISKIKLKDRHSPRECENIWKYHLHPNFIKSKWSPSEGEEVKRLLSVHGKDWDKIAKELGTNRTGHMVFVYYKAKLCAQTKPRRFSLKEDNRLMDAVKEYQFGDYIPWHRISLLFSDRDEVQLYQRYKYVLLPKNIKKGAFSEAEDVLLMFLIGKFGLNYFKISQFFRNRTAIQLRHRYKVYLERIKCNLGNFSVEEDEMILDHGANHGNWVSLGKKLDRSGTHVRQRYITLKHLMKDNPQLNIKDIPRRKQNVLNTRRKERYFRMQTCLKILKQKDKIPTLGSIQLILGKSLHAPKTRRLKFRLSSQNRLKRESTVDQALTKFLEMACKLNYAKKQDSIDTEDINFYGMEVVSLANVLGGNIDMFDSLVDESFEYFMPEEKLIVNNVVKKFKTIKSKNLPLDDINKGQVKLFLPPNINSLALVRGLLLYYHINSEKDINTANALPLHNEVDEERQFMNVLKVIFKWPAILSEYFPDKEVNDRKVALKRPEPPRKVGRPRKTVNKKIIKMNEARKKARLANLSTEKVNEMDQEESVLPPKEEMGRSPINTKDQDNLDSFCTTTNLVFKGNNKQNSATKGPDFAVINYNAPTELRVTRSQKRKIINKECSPGSKRNCVN